MMAPALAAANVPVLVQNMRDVPRWDALNARLDNATLLRQAGVNVVIAQNDDGRDRDLRWSAGNAVRNGMSWDDALRAITLAPAQAFGVADRMGSLEAGRIADVVVWSGDPLDFASQAEHADAIQSALHRSLNSGRRLSRKASMASLWSSVWCDSAW